MAKTRPMRRLNTAPSKVIAEEILKENPEGLPDEAQVVIATKMPEYREVQFINGRDTGQTLYFHYSSATHPLKHYTLVHGQNYNLPVEIIEHLESCREPVYSYRRNIEGHQEHFISSFKYIFQCRNVPRRAA